MFRVGVLSHVLAAREAGKLPGSHTYYNLTSLCEDYEMTIAMKTLGYRLISPPRCRPWTHAMPTVAKLRGQRVRWTRGALDDLKMYGWTKVTRTYTMAQIGRLLAMISPLLFAGVRDIAAGHLRAHCLGHPVDRGQFRVRRGTSRHCPEGRVESDADIRSAIPGAVLRLVHGRVLSTGSGPASSRCRESVEGNLMPGNISPTSVPGILGFMVLAVTILFMVLALSSIPRPDWLYNLFHRQHADPVPRKRD